MTPKNFFLDVNIQVWHEVDGDGDDIYYYSIIQTTDIGTQEVLAYGQTETELSVQQIVKDEFNELLYGLF